MHMDWSPYYPAFASTPDTQKTDDTIANNEGQKKIIPLRKDVEVADIGCGFGGLLVALAPVLPETLLLGKARITPLLFPTIN